MRRFHGVATKNLPNYLGWRRALEAWGDQASPQNRILGAIGRGPYQNPISALIFCFNRRVMFLRRIERRKNGKTHLYWSVVENKRLDDGRVVQRQVLYLGEINSSQAQAWRKAVEVFDAEAGGSRTLALFSADRCKAAADDASAARLRLSGLRPHRPHQWGACWLAGLLWRDLQLDRFWAERLPASRKRTRWDQILHVLVAYRVIDPGSEWRLHREWFGKSAMADLLGSDFGLAEAHKLMSATTCCSRTRTRCSRI
jgi:hypothetical protein